MLPGIIDTYVNASWLNTPEARQGAAEMSALGRIGEAADVADIVAFLASPDGRWMTGQMLDATGAQKFNCVGHVPFRLQMNGYPARMREHMMRVGKTGGYHVIPFGFGQEQINQMVPM
ncbi:hypothetical protein BGX30_012631 [Mortierella sp. GBA39]|nr:hypothetical protein BGX30_012631 [Mortierella sp. GBA39]